MLETAGSQIGKLSLHLSSVWPSFNSGRVHPGSLLWCCISVHITLPFKPLKSVQVTPGRVVPVAVYQMDILISVWKPTYWFHENLVWLFVSYFIYNPPLFSKEITTYSLFFKVNSKIAYKTDKEKKQLKSSSSSSSLHFNTRSYHYKMVFLGIVW